MSIQDMHYDLKKKFNKIDSQQNRNLLIPEIDWSLNEAMNLFIKMIAEPRNRSYLGFEINQRSIDDIRTIIVNEESININNNIATLPKDYLFYISSYCKLKKGDCVSNSRNIKIRQHDDDFKNNVLYKSSFEWRAVNAVFINEGVKFYIDDTFTIENFYLSYIRKPKYMHFAQGYRNGTYNLPSGISLSGIQNCELPEHTHSEIVDIAILLLTGELESDYQYKKDKLNLNDLQK